MTRMNRQCIHVAEDCQKNDDYILGKPRHFCIKAFSRPLIELRNLLILQIDFPLLQILYHVVDKWLTDDIHESRHQAFQAGGCRLEFSPALD